MKIAAQTICLAAADRGLGCCMIANFRREELAAALAIGLFVFIPTFAVQLIPWGAGTANIWKSLSEGFVRLLIFLLYIFGIGFMKDIGRLYQYHGAEHKVIDCYEHDAEITPESAKRFSRFHPRCGTNYLFLVMAVSILFFAALPYSSRFLIRFLTRLIFLPVVAGISYEVLRAAASSDGWLARAVRAPGLALQHLTTKEPTEDMLEVAIASFELALHPPKGDLEFDTKANAPEPDRKIEPEEIPEPEPAEEQPEEAENTADEASDAETGEGGDE